MRIRSVAALAAAAMATRSPVPLPLTERPLEQQPVGGGKAAAGGERDAGLDTAEPWWGTFLDRAPAQGAGSARRTARSDAGAAAAVAFSAGIAAQNALKYLLGFGEVAFLLSYNAVTNEFQSRMTYPDPRKAAAPTPGA